MSKPPIRIPDPPPDPPAGVTVDYRPTLDYEAAARWCTEVLGIPMTARTLKKAVMNGKLPRTILMGKLRISTADLWAYLMGLRGFPADRLAVSR